MTVSRTRTRLPTRSPERLHPMSPVSQHQFTVILVSERDRPAYSAFKGMNVHRDELVEFALLSVEENPDVWVDPKVHIVPSGIGGKATDLFAWLATHRPTLDVLSIVAAQSAFLEDSEQEQLLRAASLVQSLSVRYAPQVTTRPIRLGLFAEGETKHSARLFTSGSVINLLVIPRDSQSHVGMSQPVTSDKTHLHEAHIKVEAATVLGLWREMNTSVLDDLRPLVGGDGEIRFRFVGSRLSVLDCPPLPIAEVIVDNDQLAVPNEYEPYPNPSERLDLMVQEIYPKSLRFQPSDEPSGKTAERLSVFLRRYAAEFGRAVIGLPRALYADLQSDLNSMAGKALQDAIGGADSNIRILFPDTSSNEPASVISQKDIDELIERVIAEADRPNRISFGDFNWRDLIRKLLGLIDGSESADSVRTSLGQENWLVVDRHALGPDAENEQAVVRSISQPLNSAVRPVLENQEARGTRSDTSEASVTDNTAHLPELGETDSPLDQGPVESHSVEESPNSLSEPVLAEFAPPVLEGGEVLNNQDMIAPMPINHDLIAISESVEGSTAKPSQFVPKDLLTAVFREFVDEAAKARDRTVAMVERLRVIPSEFAPRDVATISLTVRISLLLGLAIAYFTTGTVTDRRYWLSGEPLTSFSRDFIWTFLATVVMCISLAGLLVKTSGRWQFRAILAFVTTTSLVAMEWLFFAPVRNFILQPRFLRTTAVVGASILALTLAVSLLSYIRNRFSKSETRRRYATLLLVCVLTLCVVGVTAYFGNDRSPLRRISDSTQFRLMILGYVLALSLVIGAAAVNAFTFLRERYRLNLLAELLTWAEIELKESAVAEKSLSRAAIQWLGSASVLARIFKYPLGKTIFDGENSQRAEVDVNASLMKFMESDLELTERGKHGLASKLRSLFVRRGWLDFQYHQLTDAFQSDWAFSHGLNEGEGKRIRPESCSMSPTLEEVLSGEARGARWQFMKSVYEGKYDEKLFASASEVRLEDAYGTIILDSQSHSISDYSFGNAVEFFARIIPEKAKLLDGGLVTTLFAGNDLRQNMSSYVWWPQDLVPRPADYAQVPYLKSLQVSGVLSPNRISSWIRLLGACVSVSEPFSTREVAN